MGWCQTCRSWSSTTNSNPVLTSQKARCSAQSAGGAFTGRVIEPDTSNTSERQKPVWEQHGAVQCSNCSHWFRSQGGLTVHRCDPRQSPSDGCTTRSGTRHTSQQQSGPVQCQDKCVSTGLERLMTRHKY